MKMPSQKYFFNMVEVALAMAIIAIGLSSILVLFPVGLNANKAAIADNNLADIAEYIIGYLRASASADWNKDGTNGFLTTLEDDYSKVKGGDEASPGDSTTTAFQTKWQAFGADQSGTRLYQAKNTNGKGLFLFRQSSYIQDGNGTTVEVPDFSAIIKVWKDDTFDFYGPVVYGAPPYAKFSDDTALVNALKNYATALCVEISWPSEVPLSNRERRTFRFEIFNESYEAKTTP